MFKSKFIFLIPFLFIVTVSSYAICSDNAKSTGTQIQLSYITDDTNKPTKEFRLWSTAAPGALGNSKNDIPTLTYYASDPNKAVRAALIICPGGGYSGLSRYEGHDYALWYNQFGITCFVLKYRVSNHGYHHPCMQQDAARAVRLVRANAAQWNIDINKIGVVGSSAGGHLIATLMTHFDNGNPNSPDLVERQSCRPDLGILCYPVITMGKYTVPKCRVNLLGENASQEMIDFLSNELHVTSDTPACFIWHTGEDKLVPVENSLNFAMALQKAGIPYDLHIYKQGPHGIGLNGNALEPNTVHPWAHDSIFWLKAQGFLQDNKK